LFVFSLFERKTNNKRDEEYDDQSIAKQ